VDVEACGTATCPLVYHVHIAGIDDLPAILSLQRLAYQSEALLHDDFTIPPLTQNLESLQADYNAGVILKPITPEYEIIGSVRGRYCEDTLHIGRLIVHPSFQNQGIGTALLLAMEALYPHTRYELFTSDKSEKNLEAVLIGGNTGAVSNFCAK